MAKPIIYSNVEHEAALQINRRHFLSKLSLGIGSAALASLLPGCMNNASNLLGNTGGGLLTAPHFAPKAKRVIYLFQSGSPSQMDLFDYKPKNGSHAWSGTSRVDSERPAANRHDRQSSLISPGAHLLRFPATRTKRGLGQ